MTGDQEPRLVQANEVGYDGPPGFEHLFTSLSREQRRAAILAQRMDELSIHGQEPALPSAGEEKQAEGVGVDRISDLPDAMLGIIVSLLPTARDVARTRVLATRWRDIWLVAPLSLDHADLPAGDVEAVAGIISGIVSAHRGPGHRFCIHPRHLYETPDVLDAWFQSAALDNLQELNLWDGISGFPHVRRLWTRPLPASAFRFSATLRIASFCKCRLKGSTIRTLQFPQLRELALDQVYISEGSLHAMISSCPALELLLLNRNSGFGCVRISSRSLRSIGVGRKVIGKVQFRKLIIVDAPCLKRLIHLQPAGPPIVVSVISAPKLETLGPFEYRQTIFVFGGTVIQNLRVISLSTVVCSVKILAINENLIDVDMVIQLLKCFPSLEKLYMKSCVRSGKSNEWRCKHKYDLIKDIDIRLKTVMLEPYSGTSPEENFVSFFVLNAKKLEFIKLGVKIGDYNEAFFAHAHKVLEMEKRASRGARLDFAEICLHDQLHIDRVHDLSLADPFECSE